MKAKDLVPIQESEEYTLFASNDINYKGTIKTKIPKRVILLVEDGDMNVDIWNSMLIQKDM